MNRVSLIPLGVGEAFAARYRSVIAPLRQGRITEV
jgi:hypothetical protein